MVRFDLFDHATRRVIGFREFHCCIREIATARVVEYAFGATGNPGPELRHRIAGIVGGDLTPPSLSFDGHIAQTLNN